MSESTGGRQQHISIALVPQSEIRHSEPHHAAAVQPRRGTSKRPAGGGGGQRLLRRLLLLPIYRLTDSCLLQMPSTLFISKVTTPSFPLLPIQVDFSQTALSPPRIGFEVRGAVCVYCSGACLDPCFHLLILKIEVKKKKNAYVVLFFAPPEPPELLSRSFHYTHTHTHSYNNRLSQLWP